MWILTFSDFILADPKRWNRKFVTFGTGARPREAAGCLPPTVKTD